MRRVRTTAGKRKYQWDYQELRYLVYVLTEAKDFRDTLNLFLDLHTPKEISEIIRRVIITSYLIQEKPYEEIQRVSGASPNTIARLQQKFYRPKSVLKQLLNRAGDFEKFQLLSHKDPISLRVDRFLSRATLGLIDSNRRLR